MQRHFLFPAPCIHSWCSTLKPQECFELDFPLNPHSLAVQLAWATSEHCRHISACRITCINTWSMFTSFWISQQSTDIETSSPQLPYKPDCIPRLIWVLIQALQPISSGSSVKVRQEDPSVLTSICFALNHFNWSVLFNLCAIWTPQAWRTEDETKCLLSCKYYKWNLDVAPPHPSTRGVYNYWGEIRLLCQVKCSAYSLHDCCSAKYNSAVSTVLMGQWRGMCLSVSLTRIEQDKIWSFLANQVVKSLLHVSLQCLRGHYALIQLQCCCILLNMVVVYGEIVFHSSGFMAMIKCTQWQTFNY